MAKGGGEKLTPHSESAVHPGLGNFDSFFMHNNMTQVTHISKQEQLQNYLVE